MSTKFSELLSLVEPVYAQDRICTYNAAKDSMDCVPTGGNGSTLNITITAPPGTEKFADLGDLISSAIGAAIVIAAVLALIYLVWGGIQWITSGGDKTALEAARGRITNAIVGLIVVVAAYAIFVLVTEFIGIESIVGQQ